MEEQKECKNCCYYKNLYVIYKARLTKAGGYCNNEDNYRYCTNNRFKPKLCAKWKPELTTAETERENIDKVLKDIRKSLKEISQILKRDEN